MIKNEDSIQFLKSHSEFSADVIYSDPPYALGSEIIIREDGKVDYKNAKDFMNKWDMPTGDWWEEWFTRAFRTLKYGGHLIMFGMDRQLLLFKYYAHLAGFTEKQSMYWYFISNFPKATDLSKMIDKNAGAEREKIGENKSKGIKSGANNLVGDQYECDGYDITAPSTPLAKKYSGYKYSIAPLKQTNETIMIFQRPYKTGSCLHDTLAMENGDKEITCGSLDIDRNRVGTVDDLNGGTFGGVFGNGKDTLDKPIGTGRYPSQTLVDSQVAESVLGEQSKILHKCDFEKDKHDLYIYCPKVSKAERNAGCEEMEEKEMLSGLDRTNRTIEREDGSKTLVERFGKKPQRNTHPCLKPIALNEKVLKLFKTPNEQKILYPFAGSGSEVIGGIKAGFTNWEGCELNEEYIAIANARIKHWTQQNTLL